MEVCRLDHSMWPIHLLQKDFRIADIIRIARVAHRSTLESFKSGPCLTFDKVIFKYFFDEKRLKQQFLGFFNMIDTDK